MRRNGELDDAGKSLETLASSKQCRPQMHASAVEDLQKRQSKLILLEQLSIVNVDSKRLSLTDEAV